MLVEWMDGSTSLHQMVSVCIQSYQWKSSTSASYIVCELHNRISIINIKSTSAQIDDVVVSRNNKCV